MVRQISLSLLLAATTSACIASETVGKQANTIKDGTAEAAGVLSFLNGPDATFTLLDDDVGLDRRAATSITEFTRGADELYGTSDDGRLETMDELDGLFWVGSSAINAILAHVESIGGIPEIEVEGVFLTSEQAAQIVATVNGATLSELDDAARLDSRAASGLVAARPLADVMAVAIVPYVGSSALRKLTVYAETWEPGDPSIEFSAQVASIFAEHGLAGASVDFPADIVAEQAQLFGDEVSFSEALDAALTSFVFDDYDAESPREVVRNAGPWEPCYQVDDAERLMCFLNLSSTVFGVIRHEGDPDEVDMHLPEQGERPIDAWIVYLLIPSTGDHKHWAVVERNHINGEVSVYNYGFN
jgi:hypothetical protein